MFDDRTESIMLYEHPCGCPPAGHSLRLGAIYWRRPTKARAWDLIECRQCGAVWTQFDARPDVETAIWGAPAAKKGGEGR